MKSPVTQLAAVCCAVLLLLAVLVLAVRDRPPPIAPELAPATASK